MSSSNALVPITGTNGYQQHIDINTNEPLNLTVSNASGEVRVAASDNPQVWVVVRRTKGDVDPEEPVAMAVEVNGNTINIHPDWNIASGLSGLARRIKDQLKEGLNPDDWNFSKIRFHPDLEYDIRVEVPRNLVAGSKLTARTASGSVDVNAFQGDVSSITGSGSITLNQLEGEISAHSGSGSIHANRIKGSLETNTASGSVHVDDIDTWTAIRTVSGSIKVGNAILRNGRFATVSGSIKGEFSFVNSAEYIFDSVSGSFDIDGIFPASGQAATLSFRAISGSARADGAWIEEGRKQWRLGDGESGPVIKVKAVSGSLKAHARTDANLVARNEPLPGDVLESQNDDNDDEANDHDLSWERGDFDFDFDAKIEKMVSWAKDTARNFTAPTPPTPPTPPTSASPAAPATPATPAAPSMPPTPPVWSSSDSEATGPVNHIHVADQSQETAPIAEVAPVQENQASELHAELSEDPNSMVNRPTSNQESLSVLEALERGEIDIDEALSRIENDKPSGA